MEKLAKLVGEIQPILSKCIEEETENRRLSPHVFEAMKKAGLFKLYLPKSLGGSETDPLTTAHITEKVASHNTAAGWSMMVANTSAWWCNRLSEKGIEEIYKDGADTFIAGAFHPPMRATPTNGGYIINGRSPLASNVHEAKYIFVCALVMDGDQPKMINGMPALIAAFLNTANIQILDTWHTIGMKATDSNDIVANGVFVPIHLSYFLDPSIQPNKYHSAALYKYPALGVSVASLIPPVALAIARNAINELKSLAASKVPFGSAVSMKERGSVQRKLGMAEAMVQSASAYLHHVISKYWNKTIDGESLSMEERADLLLAATHTNQSCVQAVDLMYAAAGSTAIYTKNKLSRHMCDMQVIRQHGFSNESRFETAAQVYFGLQPDLPVLAF
jgi:indole-3-acetate monooxygenase